LFSTVLSPLLVAAFVLGFVSHQVSIPSVDVDKDLPAFGTQGNINPQHYAIVQLGRDDDTFCSAYVADANYIITAGHCISGNDGHLNRKPLQIFDRNGKNTGIIATPVGLNNRVDVGLIKGDFRNFETLPTDFYGFTPTNSYGVYQTCGFPYLQNKITCTNFVPKSNDGFTLSGNGFLIPGMSGGPVYDSKNKVVIGVNSAMGRGSALIAPTLGLLGAFGIEPKTK
jgi:hypothetical protein